MRCRNCNKATRPNGTLARDYPGTIANYAQGYCMTCYRLIKPPRMRAKRPADCVSCERPMRPNDALARDYPGSVAHKAGGLCKTCHNREQRLAEDDTPLVVDAEAEPEVVAGLDRFQAQRAERIRKQERLQRVLVAQEAARRQFLAQRRNAA